MSQQVKINNILHNYKVIAVVGLSKDPEKASFQVAFYLKGHGYKIIPVNPTAEKILGEKSYKSLLDIPVKLQKTIEIVDVFRKPEEVPQVVEQSIKLKQLYGKPFVIWMQYGAVNKEAAKLAEKEGLIVVADECIMKKHRGLNKIKKNDNSNA
ncbi:MAG: CoA-binding protein [Crenarchaeota archaeon]|nr:CoA-binding protein [Thermoproteota archaeon]